MNYIAAPRPRLLIRKPFALVHQEAAKGDLKRVLGPVQLVLLGIGCIIGSGIFVLTGTAAATYAGPAVLISFVIAGFACAFAAFCYAELGSAMPVSGSSYSYTYSTLGEAPAWTTGWLMVLEYGVAVALIAVAFSGYFTSLLRDFGIDIPAVLATPYIVSAETEKGVMFTAGHGVNVIAALGVLGVAALLTRGITVSAVANAIFVAVKVSVLLAFVAVGIYWVAPENWTPFIPEHEGGWSYGWPGIFRAASMIFFAYVGFETVSCAGAEARNPQRDMRIGILGALVACTVLYLAVAAVLTGIVPYRQLAVPDPIAIAVNAMGLPWFASLVKFGAVIGLFSVMLASLFGQTRVFYSISNDGLLPGVFSRVHPRTRAPVLGTVIVGAIVALVAALLPIGILSDLVSLGTALAFGVVCLTVIWLRNTHPELPRPFRVPLGGVRIGGVWIGIVPALGILFALMMVIPLIADISQKAMRGNSIPALLLLGYAVVGAAIYIFYGMRHSKLNKGEQA